MRRLVLALILGTVACSSTSDDASTSDGSLPECADRQPPTGACAAGAACGIVGWQEHCPGGGIGAQRDYSCTCGAGTWTCLVTNQSLGICAPDASVDTAPDAPDVTDSNDATDANDATVDARTDTTDVLVDEASGCAFDGGACSTGCYVAHGQAIDTTRGCVGPDHPIGCVDAVDGPTVFACVKRADTSIAYRTQASTVPTGPEWTSCTGSETALARDLSTPNCP